MYRYSDERFFLADRWTRTRHADFRACLPKPFTPDELVNTILVS